MNKPRETRKKEKNVKLTRVAEYLLQYFSMKFDYRIFQINFRTPKGIRIKNPNFRTKQTAFFLRACTDLLKNFISKERLPLPSGLLLLNPLTVEGHRRKWVKVQRASESIYRCHFTAHKTQRSAAKPHRGEWNRGQGITGRKKAALYWVTRKPCKFKLLRCRSNSRPVLSLALTHAKPFRKRENTGRERGKKHGRNVWEIFRTENI